MGKLRIGVDAFNLAADRRGMGRTVRTMLSGLRESSDAVVYLIARNAASERALRREFDFETLSAKRLRSTQLDAVWYPWNGMRFDAHAPSVVTVHDLFAFTFPARNFIARRREQFPIRRALERANLLLPVSHWTASELRREFDVPADRIRVLPPSRDPFWHPVASASRGPYVLFVAGPDKRKNAASLFRAYAEAFGRSKEPVLVVAGTLSAEDEKELSAQRIAHERVKPGDAELRELYSGALAVVVPSLAEGYGMPVVEAMACGAPVIASDAAALPETCGGAALLVRPSDKTAWSRALRLIASDEKLREELRDRGFTRANAIDPNAPVTALLESVRRLREAAG